MMYLLVMYLFYSHKATLDFSGQKHDLWWKLLMNLTKGGHQNIPPGGCMHGHL